MISAIVLDGASALQVQLTNDMPTFCMLNYQDRVVKGYDQQTGQTESQELKMSNAMEIHYSVSGVNQDKVLFTVYKQERLPNDSFRTEQKQIH